MQIFPSTARNLWNIWELPVMVVVSLFLQVILIPMGYKRKHSSKQWLRSVLWFAYLSADWVATVSLGILSNNEEDESQEPRYVIRAFWAPFLLLHLGGPDSITAYSIQDNDLWLRHLLGLVIQSGLAFYVFFRALQPTNLNFLSIPIFVSGLIKYGERTWVLRSTCSQYLRDLTLPDPSLIRNVGGHKFPSLSYIHRDSISVRINYLSDTDNRINFPPKEMLHLAYDFFKRNKRIFSDLVLSSHDLEKSLYYFEIFSCEDAFKVIELELGFMYDFFYTKASIINSKRGVVLRFISLSSITITVGTFCIINRNGNGYPPADVYLTFFLLFGALGLEICAIVLIICSDWSVIWMTKSKYFLVHLLFKATYWSISKKRWSNSVPQYNLISHCLKEKKATQSRRFWGSSYIRKLMETTQNEEISKELKERIFKQLKQKLEEKVDVDSKNLGDWTLKKHYCYDKFGWSLELDLDQSIVLWHIATDICYYSDHKCKAPNPVLQDGKSLSDFLTYLLVNRHSLFPEGMSRIRFRNNLNDCIQFLKGFKSLENIEVACKSMLDCDPRILPKDVKEDRYKSVFYHGCRLAQELKGVEENERWEIISDVWVEMLTTISSQCRWYDHAEQLGHGGDLLTHVWLLMVHFGFTKQLYK